MRRHVARYLTLGFLLAASPKILAGQGPTVTFIDAPGANATSPVGIAPGGEIVGSYLTNCFPCVEHGFLLSAGEYRMIGVPGARTSPHGINAPGDIVGTYAQTCGLRCEIEHGFLLRDGEFTSIDVPGAVGTHVTGINPASDIVGIYSDCGDYWQCATVHGFVLTAGGEFWTLDVPGARWTLPAGINTHGDIVGSYRSDEFHGFLLSGHGLTTIDVPDAEYTQANGINDEGDIVGTYGSGGPGFHAFLLRGGAFVRIDDVVAGAPTGANAIDARGDILGSYYIQGLPHGFLLSW